MYKHFNFGSLKKRITTDTNTYLGDLTKFY